MLAGQCQRCDFRVEFELGICDGVAEPIEFLRGLYREDRGSNFLRQVLEIVDVPQSINIWVVWVLDNEVGDIPERGEDTPFGIWLSYH